MEWDELPRSRRVQAIAQYFMANLVKTHVSDAESRALEREYRSGSS